MAAGQKDFLIEQGATFRRVILVKDSAGAAIDLTGGSVAMDIRADIEDVAPLVSVTAVITDASSGEITISLTDTQTSALAKGCAVYDLELTLSGDKTRLLEGEITISREVTR